jgi:hypothetical protein
MRSLSFPQAESSTEDSSIRWDHWTRWAHRKALESSLRLSAWATGCASPFSRTGSNSVSAGRCQATLQQGQGFFNQAVPAEQTMRLIETQLLRVKTKQ